MAKFAFEIECQTRDAHGKGASRRLRNHENLVLGVVYGGDEKPESIALNHFHVSKALENEAVYSHILTLTNKGKKQRVVLKDIQRHPYKPRVLHMDFLRISENKPIIMHVPLHFPGQETAPGVTMGGGIVTHHMVELEVKCLPRDLPEFLEVDLADAEINTIVHLSQVKLPKGVELTSVVHGHEDDLPVVSITKPKRAEIEEEAAAALEATTEVEAKGKEKDKGKDA